MSEAFFFPDFGLFSDCLWLCCIITKYWMMSLYGRNFLFHGDMWSSLLSPCCSSSDTGVPFLLPNTLHSCSFAVPCLSILLSPFFHTTALPCAWAPAVSWQGMESHCALKQHNVGIPLLFICVNRSWTVTANLQNDSFKFTLVLHYFIIKF